jgi:hypothetical protein
VRLTNWQLSISLKKNVISIHTTIYKKKNLLMKKNLILLLSIMITLFVVPCFAQNITKFKNKDATYRNIDGKIISSKEYFKISKKGEYSSIITDLGNGKKEIQLVKKDNGEINLNTKNAIFKDIDGKIISSEEYFKISKKGEYSSTITDLGNGKKEVQLVKKDSGKSTIK